MRQPDTLPKKVLDSLSRFAQRHDLCVHELKVEWDSMNGCYFFWRGNVYHGVELDGYIHT